MTYWQPIETGAMIPAGQPIRREISHDYPVQVAPDSGKWFIDAEWDADEQVARIEAQR